MKLTKTLKALALLTVLVLTVYGCRKDKKDSTTPSGDDIIASVTTILNVQDGAAVKYQEVLLATKDTIQALVEMGKWLDLQPGVDKVFLTDESIVGIHYSSGLKSSIVVIKKGPDGLHQTRGGGGGNTLIKNNFRSAEDDEKLISNNKVMVFIPVLDEFYQGGQYPYAGKFAGGTTPLEVSVVTRENANLNVINTFKDYGLVIINTHGMLNGFLINTGVAKLDVAKVPGKEPYTEAEVKDLLASANGLPLDKVANGELEFSEVLVHEGENSTSITTYQYILVTENYVKNMPKLNNTVVFGNHCYSGNTNENGNMMQAWKEAGAAVYYGYAFNDGSSMAVANEFSLRMEDSFITNLVINGDSTGTAHLANDVTIQPQLESQRLGGNPPLEVTQDLTAVQYMQRKRDYMGGAFYFKQFMDVHYKYGCGTFTDPRDQEQYKLVCIGDQKWFAENLRYAGAGVDYNNNSANRALHGRLYTLTEATGGVSSSANPSGVQGICPQGTHLPSEAEWNQLFTAVGGLTAAETKLRSTEGWAGSNQYTNESGFNMLASGCFEEVFFYKDTSAYFWTTTANGNSFIALNAYPPGLNLSGYSNNNQFNWKFSCRCVVD